MGAFSQMSEKCQKCPNKEHCDHKRMEACAYIDDPSLASSVAPVYSLPVAAPVLRETVSVGVCGVQTTIYKDELEKMLYEQLRKSFQLGCAFQSGT